MPKFMTMEALCRQLRLRERLLGLDYGRVRIGLAIGDPESRLATPLEVYTRASLKKDVAYIRELMVRENIGGLVIGWPCHMDGTKSPLVQATEEFMLNFERISGAVPYIYWDERLSTHEAEARQKSVVREALRDTRRPHRTPGNADALAATLVLQSALDTLTAS